MVSILAEVDQTGSLYACGSVNIWIGLIFIGLLIGNAGSFVWAFTRDNVAWLILAVLGFFVSVPAGWFLAAYLAEGSCS